MLYEMIYGTLPFVPSNKYGGGIYGLTNCVLESEPVYDEKIISAEGLNFIKKCLQKDKKRRPRMENLMQHPWIIDTTSKLGR